jgi:hypothetical protein
MEKKLCAVPSRDGVLVLLKHVYTSWCKDGIMEMHDSSGLLPPYTTPDHQLRVLAPLDQIQMVHVILNEFFPTMEPPFKIQFKKEGEEWCDIVFSDQVRIASVMFYMKRIKKKTERRLVHNDQFLIFISLDNNIFKFELVAFDESKQSPTSSRLVVTDGNFDFSSS